jgi:uracil-DNA glycosylase
MLNVPIRTEWHPYLSPIMEKTYFRQLLQFLDEERAHKTIFPPQHLVFNAFNRCEPSKVKVVIIGQDPYHGVGQAHGLSFSVPEGVKCPPSLRNIFKELELEYGQKPSTTDLSFWADQGVFLLNAILTVQEAAAGSHQKKGWEQFTNEVIELLSQSFHGIVFLLWGNFAIQKRTLINEEKHLVLTSSHPSPLSAYQGFLGCGHFKHANEYLLKQSETPIKWF